MNDVVLVSLKIIYLVIYRLVTGRVWAGFENFKPVNYGFKLDYKFSNPIYKFKNKKIKRKTF
jgi:hypothetical protein